MTINQIMTKVPGNQEVDIREYISNSRLETATASAHCEFLQNNCCVGFDKTWRVYSVSVIDGILTIGICPQETN